MHRLIIESKFPPLYLNWLWIRINFTLIAFARSSGLNVIATYTWIFQLLENPLENERMKLFYFDRYFLFAM